MLELSSVEKWNQTIDEKNTLPSHFAQVTQSQNVKYLSKVLLTVPVVLTKTSLPVEDESQTTVDTLDLLFHFGHELSLRKTIT